MKLRQRIGEVRRRVRLRSLWVVGWEVVHLRRVLLRLGLAVRDAVGWVVVVLEEVLSVEVGCWEHAAGFVAAAL